MLLSLQAQLNKLGDYPELPSYIRNKIFYNNISLFLGILLSAILTGRHIFFDNINPIVLLSLSVLVIFFFILLTNIYGGIIYSRFFLIYTPILVNTVFIVLTANNNQIFSNTFILGSMSYALFIFILIDFKEKYFFIFTLSISLITILFTPIALKVFDTRMILTFEEMNGLELLQKIINFVLFFSITWFLVIKNSREQNINHNIKEKTLAKINKKRKKIQLEEANINKLKEYLDNINKKEKKINLLKDLKSLYANLTHNEASLKVLQLIANELSLSQIAYHEIVIEKNKEKSQLLHYLVDNQKQDISITFEKGEGLVGTVMQKFKPILTENLPDNFINTAQKDNQFPPRFHYLYPVINHQTMFGIIEFVRNRKISTSQEDFLNQISAALAQEIYYLKACEKISKIESK